MPICGPSKKQRDNQVSFSDMQNNDNHQSYHKFSDISAPPGGQGFRGVDPRSSATDKMMQQGGNNNYNISNAQLQAKQQAKATNFDPRATVAQGQASPSVSLSSDASSSSSETDQNDEAAPQA